MRLYSFFLRTTTAASKELVLHCSFTLYQKECIEAVLSEDMAFVESLRDSISHEEWPELLYMPGHPSKVFCTRRNLAAWILVDPATCSPMVWNAISLLSSHSFEQHLFPEYPTAKLSVYLHSFNNGTTEIRGLACSVILEEALKFFRGAFVP